MKKDKEILSLIKHIGNHKRLLMAKLDRASDNNDLVMYELCHNLIKEQDDALLKCIDIVKDNNNGEWRSIVCKK